MPALDKASALAAKAEAQAKAEAAKAARLDPPFPYKVKALDRAVFGLR